ncbi:hypothetical protein MKX01_000397 [Papaver californicum]|nr:hypothetical protein MKX01_000397 [Papaver californicum]
MSASKSNSPTSSRSTGTSAQSSADAKLHTDYEKSQRTFDYSSSVDLNISNGDSTSIPSSAISAYLQKMQRSQLIQPFGCLIAVDDDKSFTVLGYSENAPEMLDFTPPAVPNIEQKDRLRIGADARTLFRSSSAEALQKATNSGQVSLQNPVLVHCRSSGKRFYAIIHPVGFVIDLVPVNPADVPITASGALTSYKLAAKAITRLQSLPRGNIPLLCDVLAREVKELTGYDRVMVYKFHENEHGEVLSECRNSELEPYLGLHYPATDIPRASRFLYLKDKVRMICDCSSAPVKVIQDEKLGQPLSLCGSTLRAPHGCHAQYMVNMGSIASLVMPVTINDDDDEMITDKEKSRKLWGLVVWHHTMSRFVPFPLKYACEFLVQLFCIQLNKEVELGVQMREKHILRMQTMLCNMLLRYAPVGIVTQSPNVMDLVKCDGAALFFKNKFWLLGTTPTEAEIRDIVNWLIEYHDGTTGLSTDSLMEAGYPGASAIQNEVCGMAAININSEDFLFWFRSQTAKEINWAGAKHDPFDNDDDRKLHPRSSFKAFLEVVKWRSLPWEDVEMDAIHSLQLILRESLQNGAVNDVDSKVQGMEELCTVANEMVHLIETASVPIFAVDSSGNVNGWNSKAAELTGLDLQQAIGKPLAHLVEDNSVEVVTNMLNLSLQGEEEKNIEIKLKSFGHQAKYGPVILVVNACCSRDIQENVIGACFVGQDLTMQKMVMDKYTRIRGDYVTIVQHPSNLIPPIFMIDEFGCCSEWNDSMQKLTGLKREEAIDKILVGEVFGLHKFGCQIEDEDTLTKLRILLNGVIAGQDGDELLFGFFDRQGKHITGVLCFLHVTHPDPQHGLQLQRISEYASSNILHELTYIRQQIKNLLNGIMFTRSLMEASELSKEHKQLMKSSTLCQEQLGMILSDANLESVEECYLEMNILEFSLGEALEAVMIQGTPLCQERQLQFIHDLPVEVSSMYLCGDNLRLQQVLSNFLINAILFTPASKDSSVFFTVIPKKQCVGNGVYIVHLEFRIAHPAPGIPEALIQQMFHHSQGVSREGLGLYISQKLVNLMKGTVQYLREPQTSSFIIFVEFPLGRPK